MKVLKKSLLNVLLALVMVFSFVFPAWGDLVATLNVKADAASSEAEFTNDGQFTVAQYGANTQE